MDRNVNLRVVDGSKSSSLSARRAWIEISRVSAPCATPTVALRKESVDRNATTLLVYLALIVALRKESVDRNNIAPGTSVFRGCRSPQGERG